MIDLHQVALTSRDDLLALETALRVSAAERYAALARAVDASEAAALFSDLAEQDRSGSAADHPPEMPGPRDGALPQWRAYLGEAS